MESEINYYLFASRWKVLFYISERQRETLRNFEELKKLSIQKNLN